MEFGCGLPAAPARMKNYPPFCCHSPPPASLAQSCCPEMPPQVTECNPKGLSRSEPKALNPKPKAKAYGGYTAEAGVERAFFNGGFHRIQKSVLLHPPRMGKIRESNVVQSCHIV